MPANTITKTINQFFFTVEPQLSLKRISRFWLAIAILFSLIYSFMALQQAFSSQYVVQDDARQHVFWMRRYLDSELFPNDLIADYFQSIAPLGYKIIYAIPAALKIDPLVISKLLPGILGLITTYYCFVLLMEFFPIPFTGFIATLLLNQNLWLQDGLVSGTPKAFAVPLLLAFLYYYLRRSLPLTSILILLCGLFYPSLVFICSGLLIVQLGKFKNNLLHPKRQTKRQKSQDIFFCFCGLAVAFIVLLPYAISTSEYAPIITLSEARSLPDFAINGRSFFFNDQNPLNFWLDGSRSGIRLSSALMPPLNCLAIFLPFLFKSPTIFPLTQKVTPKINLLIQLILVSLVMFGIAHLSLFKLHLPSRYTQNSLRIIFIIIGSISTTIIIHFLLQKIINRRTKSQIYPKILAVLSLLFLSSLLVFYPHFVQNFVWTQYQQGNAVELYEFLQQQPKDTMVASLTSETDNLPTFAQRSILVSREYAIPYHTGYYFPYRQKAIDLIAAQYSTDIAVVKKFVRQYNVDFFLIEQSSFTPEYIESNYWLKQHQPVAQNAIASLKQGDVPALQEYQDSCSVLTTEQFTLIDTKCILNQKNFY